MTSTYSLGARWLGDGRAQFLVWAPAARQVEVHLLRDDRCVPLMAQDHGYFSGIIDQVQVNDTYFYRLNDERERPDPASRYQPQGVHGASQIVDPQFAWTDQDFTPPPLRNTVFYELHVGTFTPQGTFTALIEHLPRLRELGITTLEIMPVAQCPGRRNWGYDGVQIYAPSNVYGTPDDFKTLINAAHEHGLAVFLDVVYNHLGPEGNYLWDYGSYFTNRYKGAWGDSLNFDGWGSDEVRRFFIDNAIYWLEEYHIDGLRLDAAQALLDFTAVTFLDELAIRVNEWADAHGRNIHLLAETDKSDRRLVLPRDVGGTGLDGQWLDDFHHCAHVMLTGESYGYYADYSDFSTLVKMLRTRFVHTGGYSKVAGRRHGTDASDIPADRFVTFLQTHDQVGNRMLGERLSHLADFEALKLAAGVLLTLPTTPMLFMGEEYGETAPFLFFADFSDAALVKAVREGRKIDYSYFLEAQGEPPDPDAESTFLRSKLNHELRHVGKHALLYTFYQTLLALRRTRQALTDPDPDATHVFADVEHRVVCVERSETIRIFSNWSLEQTQTFTLPETTHSWVKILDSGVAMWQLDGTDRSTTPETIAVNQTTITLPPKSVVIYGIA